MRRYGVLALVLVGFVGGIAFVYSCGGGGGSSAEADVPPGEVHSILLAISGGNSYSNSWQPHSGGESFIITDIKVDSGDDSVRFQIGDNEFVKWFADLSGTGDVQTHEFRSGIRFYPGDPIGVNALPAQGSEITVFLSGYVPN
jgi:hypothetical protein